MNIKQLLRLSQNPHYELSEEQLRQLEEYRRSQVKHNPRTPKHQTTVNKHNPKLEQEDPHDNR